MSAATVVLTAAPAIVIAMSGGSNGSGDFSFRECSLDVRLDGIALAREMAPSGGDTIIGIHVRSIGDRL